MVAAVTLMACGKSEEPAVTSPAPEVPPVAEPAPAPAEALPAEAAAPAPAAEVAAAETPAAPAPVAAPSPSPVVQPATKPAPAASKPTPQAPAAPAPAPKVDLAHGQQIYRQACAFCHDKGIAGAPKTGDPAAWGPRLAQGIDTLYTTAIRGKGAMPAKGGNPSLADADVKAAVDFIAAQSR